MAANGRLDTASLTKVDGWAFLERRTANAWNAFCAEMVSLGYARPSITAPDGAYRPYDQQVYWKKYWTDRGLPGNAATPGYSIHGLGQCVDIWNVGQYPRAVIVRVAAKYGFTFNVKSELWHVQHNGMIVAGLPSTPITADAGKKLMSIYLTRSVNNSTIYLENGVGKAGIAQPSHVDLFNRVLAKFPGYENFNDAELDIMQAYKDQCNAGPLQQILSAITRSMQNDNSNRDAIRADLHYIANDPANPGSILNVLAKVNQIPKVDATALATSIGNILKSTGVAIDYAKAAEAVKVALTAQFQKVATDASAQTDEFTAQMKKIGTIDQKVVAEAITSAITSSGVNAEQIASAVQAELKDDFFRLELKNQLA